MVAPTGKLRGLILKKVYSHEDTTIRFHPGVNIIVAPNRTGKTNLMRAANSITHFGPLGIRIQNFRDSKVVEGLVKMIFDDAAITRRRTEDANQTLVSQSIEVKTADFVREFTKLGRTLPDELIELINMGPIDIDGTELDLNFHAQKAPDFLIDGVYKGGLRLKVLGSLQNHAVYDRGLKVLKAENRDLRSEFKVLAARANVLLDQVQKQEPEIQRLRARRAMVVAAVERRRRLEAVVERLTQLRADRDRMDADRLRVATSLAGLPSRERVQELGTKLTAAQALEIRIRELRSLLGNRDLNREAIGVRDRSFNRLNRVDVQVPAQLLDRVRLLTSLRAESRALETQEQEQRSWNLAVDLDRAQALVARHRELLDLRSKLSAQEQTRAGIVDAVLRLGAEQERLETERATHLESGRCPFYDRARLQPECRELILEV